MSGGPGARRGCAEGRFRVGDVVRNGTHVGTVTDVGTVLIAVRTATGASRMVCPWELVRLRASHVVPGLGALPQ
ncbi:mechanosensitive ion channel domain-containing protein [Mycolicibacterium sp. CBMA 234]|uniref:mechanosensitive ion channel domain-containing protein n=1 Tax=Mycolicibacterium sp. CBMA 234 TaxID=1918495 RepID=UPI001391047E